MASARSLPPVEWPARDPVTGWTAALVSASIVPAAGALLGADIVRSYVFCLGVLSVSLGVMGCIATCYERLRRRPVAPARAPVVASFVE